jgi:hypothetical protein
MEINFFIFLKRASFILRAFDYVDLKSPYNQPPSYLENFHLEENFRGGDAHFSRICQFRYSDKKEL